MATIETIKADVRQFLSRRLIERIVRRLEMSDVFPQSQSWEGYTYACESWHAAYWTWIDEVCPASLAENLNNAGDWSKVSLGAAIDLPQSRGMDFSKLPPSENDKKLWLGEFARQETIQHYASFALAMRGPEAEESDTYVSFVNDMRIAKQIGDDSYFVALARQKQRKPSKGEGDRRLKPQLLLCWIPGCFWACSNEGVAAFLDAHYPRSGNLPYHPQSISRAHRELKLYHLAQPLHWGVTGIPPQLIPIKQARN